MLFRSSIIARYQAKLPGEFGSGSFVVRNQAYAHPLSAVAMACENPFDNRYSMVTLSGLSAEATIHLPARFLGNYKACEVLIMPNRLPDRALTMPASDLVHEFVPNKRVASPVAN